MSSNLSDEDARYLKELAGDVATTIEFARDTINPAAFHNFTEVFVEAILNKAACEIKITAVSEWYLALRQLYDHQNGCPLPKYEEGWGLAMDECARLITIHEQDRN